MRIHRHLHARSAQELWASTSRLYSTDHPCFPPRLLNRSISDSLRKSRCRCARFRPIRLAHHGRRNERNFIGIELDDKYFQVAERRLQRLQEILDELMTLTDWKKP